MIEPLSTILPIKTIEVTMGRIYDYKANTPLFELRKDRRMHQQKHMMSSKK
jgi:hypothetical protein